LSDKTAESRRRVSICQDCVHFFITHDPGFPYGCRSMGFKSRRHPHHEVLAATGEPCQGREVKPVPGTSR
jgi:hypothetical protein